MRKTVFADGDVPLGALVLVRGLRARVAHASVANARALPRPTWLREKKIKSGQSFVVNMLEGLGARSLQAIADGPIMDASEIYLPAGKLSVAEMRARETALFLPPNHEPPT